MARNGAVGIVNTPCTPKNSAPCQASISFGHEAQNISAKTTAPVSAKKASSRKINFGDEPSKRLTRKSARVRRFCWIAAATCRNTIATIVRAAISDTPVIGALKKFRPRTSATTSTMSKPTHNVPIDDMTAATDPNTAPMGASANFGTVGWSLGAGLTWFICDHSCLGALRKTPAQTRWTGALVRDVLNVSDLRPNCEVASHPVHAGRRNRRTEPRFRLRPSARAMALRYLEDLRPTLFFQRLAIHAP